MKKSIKKIGCSKLAIGAVLKKYRIQHGYTQNEVADLIHVSRPCYSSWENDYYEIPLSKVIQFAACFNISSMSLIDEIINGKPKVHQLTENALGNQIIKMNSEIIQMKELLSEILVKQNDGYFI